MPMHPPALPLDTNNNLANRQLFDRQNDGKTEVEDSLQKRVAARLKNIFECGIKERGIATGCSPKVKPDWFDPVAFAHAQRLFRAYEVVIRISQFYGLFLICINFKVAGTLRATGNNQTVQMLFTRFISTMIHIKNWFESDPFDPDSKSYRSLMTVRGYHRQVATKLNDADGKVAGQDELWINQKRMSLAVYEFFGLMTLFPEQLGFGTFTDYDFHAMFHFWRVIGYCLGSADKYNFCAGTDEEIRELCRQVHHHYWVPKLRRVFIDEPDGLEMYRGITLAMARYQPVVNFNVFLRHGAPFLELNKDAFPLSSLWEKTIYGFFCTLIWAANRSVVINYIISFVSRGFLWLSVKLRRFNEWRLREQFDEKMHFEGDQRCPHEVKFNYKTAMDLELF